MKRVVIGTAPLNEVGSFSVRDDARARRAAEVFARQVARRLGTPPPGVRLAVDRVADDQGVAYCAVCDYDETDEQAVDYAWRCEDEAPLEWDEVARAELADDQ